MPNYISDHNPFRGMSLKIFEDWLHHVKYQHTDIANRLWDLGVRARRKEQIWDITNEISEAKFNHK